MNKRKWLIGGLLLLVVGGLVWFNLSKAGITTARVPKNAPQVKVAPVTRQDLVQKVVAPGTLEATDIQEIRAPFSTTRVRMLVGVGEQVKAGQPLAELESDQQRVTVANLTAQVAQAQSTLSQLLEQQQLAPITAQQQLEQAKAALLQAEEGLRNAPIQAAQQVEQARATLLGIQSMIDQVNAQVEQARIAMEQAELNYRANPLDASLREAYEQARAAYEDALRTSSSTFQQYAAQLASAQAALEMAEARAEGEDPLAVQLARVNLESAKQALAAAQLRVEQTGALADQVRAAQANLNAAREALRLAQSKLDQAVVVAPTDGVVLKVALEDGQPAAENTLLYQIGTLNTLTLKARVDEVDVPKIQPGQRVTIKTNAYLNEQFEGTVTRVAAQATQPTGPTQSTSTTPYYEVQALVENPEGKLKGGMTVEATFETASRSDALVVELGSLREDEDGTFVLVVKDNKVQLRPVTVGLRTQTHAEILQGLTEGEEIVTGPFNLVRSLSDGDWVRIEAGSAKEDGR
ncbi:MAG TPA: efflux RND transporter periplasmic adaptor subunit [Symbiobacteriaceae bacterium]